MNRRGEYFWSDEGSTGTELEFDVSHLFYGHQIQSGDSFSISGINNDVDEKVSASVVEAQTVDDKIKQLDDVTLGRLGGLECILQWFAEGSEDSIIKLPLDSNNGFVRKAIRIYSRSSDKKIANNHFVTSSSLTVEKMTELFDRVVLTPEEDLVYEALQTIEPTIDRIASFASKKLRDTDRGGFVVRFKNDAQRVPIGSMGDGIWRMLGITLAIVDTKGGILLADEIDTGLHFSVMSDMWRLILKTAKRLNVQVFATTHNSDCWKSLAEIANSESNVEDGITIQRIERGKPMSIIFNERQMEIAAERGIEVR